MDSAKVARDTVGTIQSAVCMVTITRCGKAGNGLSKGGKGHSGDFTVSSLHGNNY